MPPQIPFLHSLRNVTKTSLFPIIIQSYSPALVPQLLPFLPSASGKRLPILDKGYSWSEKTDFVDYDLHINRCALAYGDELRFSWRAVPSPGGQIKGIMLRVVEMCRVRPPSLRSDPDLESHLNLMDLPLMTFSEIVKFEREEEFNGQFWKKQTVKKKGSEIERGKGICFIRIPHHLQFYLGNHQITVWSATIS